MMGENKQNIFGFFGERYLRFWGCVLSECRGHIDLSSPHVLVKSNYFPSEKHVQWGEEKREKDRSNPFGPSKRSLPLVPLSPFPYLKDSRFSSFVDEVFELSVITLLFQTLSERFLLGREDQARRERAASHLPRAWQRRLCLQKGGFWLRLCYLISLLSLFPL